MNEIVKILFICLPLGGKGDLMFSIKLKKILDKKLGPAKALIKIASPAVDDLIQLGANPQDLIKMHVNEEQVKRFNLDPNLMLSYDRHLPIHWKADLYFVTPVVFAEDRHDHLEQILRLCPNARPSVIFTFTEYNKDIERAANNFDFYLGIGNNNQGMLFTDVVLDRRIIKPYNLSNNYFFTYIADDYVGGHRCIQNFIDMIFKKYPNLDDFEIIVPEFLIEDYFKDYFDDREVLFGNKIIKTCSKIIHYDDRGAKYPDKTIIIRGDIFPVDNTTFVNLAKFSLDDVLVTGDQSFADIVWNCPEKDIWYQPLLWKQDFANELAQYADKPALKTLPESCGCIGPFCTKSNNKEIIKWNFEEIGFSKLNDIIDSIGKIKKFIRFTKSI